MAKLHHKGTSDSPDCAPAEALLATIQAFLSTCRNPAVLEYGDEIVPLSPNHHSLELRSGRLWIEIWGEKRGISRRIIAIDRRATGVLDCTVHRFGGTSGKLSFLDLDRPQTAHRSLSGERRNFAEEFRRMLFRQFPGWEIAALSSSIDLQRSFSPVFPRAHLIRGAQQIAVTACPSARDEPALLTFALIWYEHVRTHARSSMRTSLSLFLPDGTGNLTSHRLRWLNQQALQPIIFRFNAHGSAGQVDLYDLGNLETRVRASIFDGAPKWTGAATPHSERSLECIVRANIAQIDASLLPEPIHGQVLAFAGGDRDLIDLLARSDTGRLTVLELKVSEDIHLPLQALDYWIRIKWHRDQGDLQHLFPGMPLAHRSPKLLLLAPAISFHPANATILRYFLPELEVERVGINSDWQHHLKVILRLKDGDAPISHENSE